jgi:hypothetical protein
MEHDVAVREDRRTGRVWERPNERRSGIAAKRIDQRKVAFHRVHWRCTWRDGDDVIVKNPCKLAGIRSPPPLAPGFTRHVSAAEKPLEIENQIVFGQTSGPSKKAYEPGESAKVPTGKMQDLVDVAITLQQRSPFGIHQPREPRVRPSLFHIRYCRQCVDHIAERAGLYD